MLRFSLAPLRIINIVRAENGKLARSIWFDTRIDTGSDRRERERNVISDGTVMDHLLCGATIYCLGEGDHVLEKGHEYLMFYQPESAADTYIHFFSPASFYLQIYFPSPIFDDLWRMVREERRITFSGEIAREDLTQTSHNPILGGSSYEWNASDKMKVVRSFAFRLGPYEARDLPPSKLAVEYEEKYGQYSQMTRMCLDVIGQTEKEAERRGVKMEGKCPENWPTVISDLEYLYWRRQNPKHFLWAHVEDMARLDEKDHYDEDGALELTASLLKCPWLRCDELEVAMVDYMIFWELFGFLEQIKGISGSRWPSRGARKARARLDGLAEKMLWSYWALRPAGGVFSPFQIRAALLSALDAGAAWKPAVFALLDRAAARNPPVWIVPS